MWLPALRAVAVAAWLVHSSSGASDSHSVSGGSSLGSDSSSMSTSASTSTSTSASTSILGDSVSGSLDAASGSSASGSLGSTVSSGSVSTGSSGSWGSTSGSSGSSDFYYNSTDDLVNVFPGLTGDMFRRRVKYYFDMDKGLDDATEMEPCTRPFCVHLIFYPDYGAYSDFDGFIMDRYESKYAIGSDSFVVGGSVPIIRGRDSQPRHNATNGSSTSSESTNTTALPPKRTIWTLYPLEGDAKKVDIVMSLRQLYSVLNPNASKWDDELLLRATAQMPTSTRASSSLTPIIYNWTASRLLDINYTSTIVSGNQVALHIFLSRQRFRANLPFKAWQEVQECQDASVILQNDPVFSCVGRFIDASDFDPSKYFDDKPYTSVFDFYSAVEDCVSKAYLWQWDSTLNMDGQLSDKTSMAINALKQSDEKLRGILDSACPLEEGVSDGKMVSFVSKPASDLVVFKSREFSGLLSIDVLNVTKTTLEFSNSDTEHELESMVRDAVPFQNVFNFDLNVSKYDNQWLIEEIRRYNDLLILYYPHSSSGGSRTDGSYRSASTSGSLGSGRGSFGSTSTSTSASSASDESASDGSSNSGSSNSHGSGRRRRLQSTSNSGASTSTSASSSASDSGSSMVGSDFPLPSPSLLNSYAASLAGSTGSTGSIESHGSTGSDGSSGSGSDSSSWTDTTWNSEADVLAWLMKDGYIDLSETPLMWNPNTKRWYFPEPEPEYGIRIEYYNVSLHPQVREVESVSQSAKLVSKEMVTGIGLVPLLLSKYEYVEPPPDSLFAPDDGGDGQQSSCSACTLKLYYDCSVNAECVLGVREYLLDALKPSSLWVQHVKVGYSASVDVYHRRRLEALSASTSGSSASGSSESGSSDSGSSDSTSGSGHAGNSGSTGSMASLGGSGSGISGSGNTGYGNGTTVIYEHCTSLKGAFMFLKQHVGEAAYEIVLDTFVCLASKGYCPVGYGYTPTYLTYIPASIDVEVSRYGSFFFYLGTMAYTINDMQDATAVQEKFREYLDAFLALERPAPASSDTTYEPDVTVELLPSDDSLTRYLITFSNFFHDLPLVFSESDRFNVKSYNQWDIQAFTINSDHYGRPDLSFLVSWLSSFIPYYNGTDGSGFSTGGSYHGSFGGSTSGSIGGSSDGSTGGSTTGESTDGSSGGSQGGATSGGTTIADLNAVCAMCKLAVDDCSTDEFCSSQFKAFLTALEPKTQTDGRTLFMDISNNLLPLVTSATGANGMLTHMLSCLSVNSCPVGYRVPKLSSQPISSTRIDLETSIDITMSSGAHWYVEYEGSVYSTYGFTNDQDPSFVSNWLYQIVMNGKATVEVTSAPNGPLMMHFKIKLSGYLGEVPRISSTEPSDPPGSVSATTALLSAPYPSQPNWDNLNRWFGLPTESPAVDPKAFCGLCRYIVAGCMSDSDCYIQAGNMIRYYTPFPMAAATMDYADISDSLESLPDNSRSYVADAFDCIAEHKCTAGMTPSIADPAEMVATNLVKQTIISIPIRSGGDWTFTFKGATHSSQGYSDSNDPSWIKVFLDQKVLVGSGLTVDVRKEEGGVPTEITKFYFYFSGNTDVLPTISNTARTQKAMTSLDRYSLVTKHGEQLSLNYLQRWFGLINDPTSDGAVNGTTPSFPPLDYCAGCYPALQACSEDDECSEVVTSKVIPLLPNGALPFSTGFTGYQYQYTTDITNAIRYAFSSFKSVASRNLFADLVVCVARRYCNTDYATMPTQLMVQFPNMKVRCDATAILSIKFEGQIFQYVPSRVDGNKFKDFLEATVMQQRSDVTVMWYFDDYTTQFVYDIRFENYIGEMPEITAESLQQDYSNSALVEFMAFDHPPSWSQFLDWLFLLDSTSSGVTSKYTACSTCAQKLQNCYDEIGCQNALKNGMIRVLRSKGETFNSMITATGDLLIDMVDSFQNRVFPKTGDGLTRMLDLLQCISENTGCIKDDESSSTITMRMNYAALDITIPHGNEVFISYRSNTLPFTDTGNPTDLESFFMNSLQGMAPAGTATPTAFPVKVEVGKSTTDTISYHVTMFDPYIHYSLPSYYYYDQGFNMHTGSPASGFTLLINVKGEGYAWGSFVDWLDTNPDLAPEKAT